MATPSPDRARGAIDVYHVWWDPELVARIGARLMTTASSLFHISDWMVPPRDPLTTAA